jgi:hypothetical protein
MTQNETTPPSSKVERVIQRYDLEGLEVEFEHRWLGVDGEQASTRELAEDLNKRVLAVAVNRSDAFTLSGSVDELYRGLTGDDDEDPTLVRSRLEQNGVDVDAVTDDFVSHQTIYRYLKNHRGVEQPERTPDERRETAVDTIQGLRGRTTAVTEQTVADLARNDIVDVGDFSILNDIQLLCEDCGRSYDVTGLIERGGCECRNERD